MKPRSAVLALFLALLCAMLSPMAPARAASAYDNTVQIGESIVGRSVGSVWTEVDISATYMQIWEADAQNDSACASQLQSFRNAVSNGGSWYISQQRQEGTYAFKRVFIAWTQTPDAPIGFSSYLYPSNPSTAYTALRPTITGTWASSGWNEVSFDLISSGSSAGQVNVSCPSVVQYVMVARHHYNRSSNAHDIRPILVNASVQYPSGYEGVVIPDTWTPPAPTYVAMGDSFSSGEGNPPFESGTNTSSNTCHRSAAAYPRLLEAELGPADFVACSGATTDDVILNQMSALSEDTEVVTITIGGNDVGFSTFALNCVLVSCSEISQGYANVMEAINGDLQDSLETVYWMILGASGDATVYVVGYPYLTGDSANGDCQTFEIVSDLGARAVTDALNAKIYNAVENVKDDVLHPDYENRLVYVPANSNDESSPFDGSFICSSPSLYNGIDYSHQEYSFHPNSAGHAAYATLLSGS